MIHIKPSKIAALILAIVLVSAMAFIYYVHSINQAVKNETNELRKQENLLQLPEPGRRTEKNIGCTWADKQDWDLDGCYIGLSDVYDERGPERLHEKEFTESLLKNGWQENTGGVWTSSAVPTAGSNGSFIKHTPSGKFCAGFSYRYFSNDDQNGHRSFMIYILGPSDTACSRW